MPVPIKRKRKLLVLNVSSKSVVSYPPKTRIARIIDFNRLFAFQPVNKVLLSPSKNLLEENKIWNLSYRKGLLGKEIEIETHHFDWKSSNLVQWWPINNDMHDNLMIWRFFSPPTLCFLIKTAENLKKNPSIWFYLKRLKGEKNRIWK